MHEIGEILDNELERKFVYKLLGANLWSPMRVIIDEQFSIPLENQLDTQMNLVWK